MKKMYIYTHTTHICCTIFQLHISRILPIFPLTTEDCCGTVAKKKGAFEFSQTKTKQSISTLWIQTRIDAAFEMKQKRKNMSHPWLIVSPGQESRGQQCKRVLGGFHSGKTRQMNNGNQ